MPRTRGRVAIAAAVVAMVGPLLAVPAVAQAQTAQNNRHDDGRVVSAYFADWDVYGRGYNVKDIPADKLNVIQYAFAAPTFDKATGAVGCSVLDPWADYQRPIDGSLAVDGVSDVAGQALFGNFNQLLKLKKAHPGLKVEISIGGWTKSTYFADVAATAQRRQAFVKSCVDTFINGNIPGLAPGAAKGVFDGIDIDWEYPTQLAGGNVDYGPADKHNATLLMQELRKQLGPDHLLTAALPATSKAGQYWELPAAVQPMNWVNVMTYDYNVPGGGIAGPDTLFTRDSRDPGAHDPTWNTVGTVAYYLAKGVPANKIVVGVPFYGNEYLRAGGLYAKSDNSGQDSNSLAWDTKPQPTYHDLVDTAGVVGAGGYSKNWDAQAGEPWLFNPAGAHNLCSAFNADGSCATPYVATVPTVITYDDPRSIGERTALIKAVGLRGAMAWEISQDSDSHALISALSPLLH